MDYKYGFDVKENMAKAVGKNLSVSTKQCVEICRALRGKSVDRAKAILNDAISFKVPISYRRYNKKIGHKKKIGPGRYPAKSAKSIMQIIDNAINNAQLKGLATGKLGIIHICAKEGTKIPRRGRQSRRQMKRTHVEVVVKEFKSLENKVEKKAKTPKKQEKKQAEKKETKKEEVKKEQPKPEVKAQPKSEVKTEKKQESESKKESKEEIKPEQK